MRANYLAFTVDEYQDVNLLQETLLRIWLGDRDEVCVVGDDYQSIFGFTGATPKYLLRFPCIGPSKSSSSGEHVLALVAAHTRK